jgi:DNA-directed RNA polymerase subunit RPC12/RpoP
VAAVRDGVRCPDCGKKLGDQVLGLYRTSCPRCPAQVEIKTYGTWRIEDDFSVTTITVQRTEKPTAGT